MAVRPEAFKEQEAKAAEAVEAKIDDALHRAFALGQKRAKITLQAQGIDHGILGMAVQRYRAVGWTVYYEFIPDQRDGDFYYLTFVRR